MQNKNNLKRYGQLLCLLYKSKYISVSKSKSSLSLLVIKMFIFKVFPENNYSSNKTNVLLRRKKYIKYSSQNIDIIACIYHINSNVSIVLYKLFIHMVQIN